MTDQATASQLPPVEELTQFELFADLPRSLVQRIHKQATSSGVVPDEEILIEGQYDQVLYIMLSGYVRVMQSSSDGSVLIGTLKRGDFFGDMNPRTTQPSAVSVTATTDCILLELSKPQLQSILDASPHAQSLMDRTYNNRALRSELRGVSLFEGFNSEDLDRLTKTATVVRYPPETPIFDEGDVGDAFYLIRTGFVKILKERPSAKDLVLAYLREGQYFGEIALLNEDPRSASVMTLTETEVIQITKNDFNMLLESHPGMRMQLMEVISRREARNEELAQDQSLADTLEFVVNQGLMEQNTALVIDMDKCVHCDNCSDACAAIHDGHSLLVRHGPQLDTTIANIQFPTSCHHCDDPLCLTGCNFNAMERTPAGEIRIIEETCTGCNLCAKLCPYDTIAMVPRQSEKSVGWFDRLLGREPEPVFVPTSPTGKKYKRLAMQCDLCVGRAHMNCVYNCPTGAIFRVKPSDYFVGVESIS
jgi:CRP-like cAMP-binding protein/Fe-S-cluster-containing hydrogenase component 2